jgi:FkbM family methyltransferase
VKPTLSAQSKRLARNILDKLGLEIRAKGSGPSWSRRADLAGCLEQALCNGLEIETVLDVGAAYGTRELVAAFPHARHILIEPLEEFEPRLKNLVSSLERAEYVLAAATDTAGQIPLNVHPDLLGSSLYKEEEGSDVNGFQRIVPSITLGDLCGTKEAQGPYLIKIDAQGAELDVLKGAERLLPEVAIIIVEVSFFRFFRGGPAAYDCIVYLNQRGFEIYDLFNLHYRPLDGALAQADIAFVPERSVLREHHFYATPEQRQDQTGRIRKSL